MFIVKYEGPSFIRGLFGIKPEADGSCDFQAWYLEPNNLVLITIWLIVAPLATAKHIDFLGFTSGIGMTCMIGFTFIIMVYKFTIECPIKAWEGASQFFNDFNATKEECKAVVYDPHAGHFVHDADHQVCEPVAMTWNDASIYAIPTMLFAFQCHASTLPIYSELKTPNRQNMLKVGVTAIGAVWLIYTLVSFFGYFTWYNLTMKEVLMSYSVLNPSDFKILAARAASLICVIFSAPLLHYPCRKAQYKLFWRDDVEFSWPRHVVLMVFNLTLVTLTVVFGDDIRKMFGYGGAVTANSLVIILPSLFYWKLMEKDGNPTLRKTCLGLSVAGIILMIFNTYLLARD